LKTSSRFRERKTAITPARRAKPRRNFQGLKRRLRVGKMFKRGSIQDDDAREFGGSH